MVSRKVYLSNIPKLLLIVFKHLALLVPAKCVLQCSNKYFLSAKNT